MPSCRAIAKITARCALYISYSTLILFTPTASRPILCADLILNEFKLRKFCLFMQEWRFGRSRSSEVIDFGANRKSVCDFLLSTIATSVLSRTISEIWQLLCAPGPISILRYYRNFGAFQLHQPPDRPCWGQPAHKPIRPWNYVSTVPVPERHRQTDRQTLHCGNTALCVAWRGKKKSLYHEFKLMNDM